MMMPDAKRSDKDAAWTETERTVRKAWAEMLRLPEDSFRSDDNFFELGGDSLTAILLCAALEDRLGQSINLEVFAEAPTISGTILHFTRKES